MCLRRVVAGLLGAMAAANAVAAEYVVGLGIGADDSDGRSAAALVDVALTDSTFLTVSGGISDADTLISNIRTRSWDIGIAQEFEPVTLRLGVGQWGDSDRVESDDIRGGIDVDAGGWRFGLDAERRDIELVFQLEPLSPQNPPRVFSGGVNADGYGGRIRYRTEEGTSLAVRGMRWDYDRNLGGLVFFDLLRRVNPSTLTLAGSLRDSSVMASVDWEIGSHLLGFELGRDELVVGDAEVDSATVLWTIPANARTDIELSLGYSESDDGDSAYFANVFVYFFGGGT